MPVPFVVPEAPLPYAVIDLSMLLVELVLLLLLLPRPRGPPTMAIGVLVASGLVGSAGALVAVFWGILHPDLNSLTIVFEALGISMGFPPGFWIFAVIGFRDRTLPGDSLLWPVAFAGAATAGEALMGLVFAAAADPSMAPGPLAAATLLSPWYLGSSAAAMVVLVLWLPIDPARRSVLGGLAVSGVLAPWVAWDPVVGAVLLTAAMAGTLALIFGMLRGPSGQSPGAGALGQAVAAAYVAMSLAGAAVALTGGPVPALIAFGLVTGSVMLAELSYLLRYGMSRAPSSAPVDSGAEAGS